MIRLGVHDANADVQESGFDTYEKGELFRILDVGYDTSQIPRKIVDRRRALSMSRSGIRTTMARPG